MPHDLVLCTVAQDGTAAAASHSLVGTVWDMVLKGGWIMVPLGLCSLVAMTIIVERFITTRTSRVVPPGFMAALAALRRTPRQAHARCKADRSPVAAVLAAAIQTRGLPRDAQEKAIAEAGERQVRRLRHRMRLLSALPQSATMLGLLGTVLGMIRTFTVVAASGESLGKTERLAQGIYEAWTATAAGLVIAIPALIMYHLVMGRIDAAAAALDQAAVDWLAGETHARSELQPVTSSEIEPAIQPGVADQEPAAASPELALANR